VILQRYFTYFHLSVQTDLTNYGEFYRPAVNEAEKGIFIRRSDAPGKTGLKRTLSHLENCDYKQ